MFQIKLCRVAKPTECGENEWQCDNGKCINEEFLCDQTNDCTDGSDEGSICESTQVPQGNFTWRVK